jgi:hypothetical protein
MQFQYGKRFKPTNMNNKVEDTYIKHMSPFEAEARLTNI